VTRHLWLGLFLALTGLLAWLIWDFSQDQEQTLPYPPSANIRVLIKEHATSVSIVSPEGLLYIQIPEASQAFNIQRQQALDITISNGQFSFAGFEPKAQNLQIYSESGQIQIDGHSYTGQAYLSQTSLLEYNVILHLPLEHYVARVVDGEMKSSWPKAALEAQAIAARSFAVYHVLRNKAKTYDLRGDARAQAFARNLEHPRCRNAAILTQGLLLKQNQAVLLAYYMSTCGGSTRKFYQAGMRYDNIPCQNCQDSPYYQWKEQVPLSLVQSLLGQTPAPEDTITSLELEWESSQHVKAIIFKKNSGPSLKVDANDFRRYLNAALKREVMKSLRFELSLQAQQLVIDGHGWGYHGIGLCQYGARHLAQTGSSTEAILKYYYPSASVEAF
jgi:stage II sporulation protein D